MRIKKLDLNLLPQLHAQEVIAKRRVLSKTLEGSWTTMLKGRGMEFAGFRKYTYGDDASRIDWGASLRSKETLIREFEEYKNVNVLFMVDASDSMLFTSTRKLKAEYAAELAFLLAASILDNGDSIGFALWNSRVVGKEQPAFGREILAKFSAALSDPRNYGGPKDFRVAVNSVNALLKTRALIIIISDFIDLGTGWEQYIRMLSEKNDLIGICLRDPRDRDLPEADAQVLLDGPSGGGGVLVDVAEVRARYAAEVRREEAYLEGVFRAAHAGLVTITTGADLIQPVLAYFRRRSAIIR